MKKCIFLIGLLCGALPAIAESVWTGEWLYEPYQDSLSGALVIKECTQNKCPFEIQTIHGAHTCSIDGIMAINGNQGVYNTMVDKWMPEEDTFQKKEASVTFDLNPHQNRITVEATADMYTFCGMRGFFEGMYESAKNPKRYPTSFDCFETSLTPAQQTICASETLARADKELALYDAAYLPADWKKKQTACETDTICLHEFYRQTLQTAFENKTQKPFTLYGYTKEWISSNKWFAPKDLFLLSEALKARMPAEDYTNFSMPQQDYYRQECSNCLFTTYGVAGFYTMYEAAFWMNNKEMWLTYLWFPDEKEDEDSFRQQLVIYMPYGKTIADIPSDFQEFIIYLQKKTDKGKYNDNALEIVYKNFMEQE